ncbi:putative bifunctional diguanylate cyclase/phosphodiesterase [Deinococcus aquaedulcis]|uniref:putative bifunctional diguanylate cyclase/phosphodiesterase n=1 Tax=Deinococcus aquaedulcis TaxID=2840455 RepID=UPI001C8372E4|nr:GGDEF domain-containing phosphodiesterase [Deinococcus aquaedulcis]
MAPAVNAPLVRSVGLLALVLAFVLPLTVILSAYTAQAQHQIRIARDEQRGLAIIGPLLQLLVQLDREREVAHLQSADRLPAQQAVQTAMQQVTQAVQAHPSLDAAAAWQTWQDTYRAGGGSVDEPLRAQTLSLITHVADTSSLVLDPELPSFYLMDLLVRQLPVVTAQSGALRWAGMHQLQRSQPAQPALLPGELQGTSDSVRRSWDKVRETRRPVPPELIRAQAELHRRVSQQLAWWAGGVIRGQSNQVQAYRQTSEAAVQSALTLYGQGAPVLHAMLGERAARLTAQRNAVLGLAALMVLFSLVAFRGFWVSIRDSAQHQRSLLYLANHDGLTGLLNRPALDGEVSRLLADPPAHLAVYLIDLDQFKTINASFGPPFGDRVLVEVARRLNGVAAPNSLLARQSADEFILVERGPVSAARAEALLDSLRLPWQVDGRELLLQASIGAAEFPAHGDDSAGLLRHADTALARIKAQGGNGHTLYTPDMEEDLLARLTLEQDLRRALARQELFLTYQPLVDTQTGQVRGLEALVRWAHPTRGLVSPADFIPVAEDTGLIVPIGTWVLREACSQMQTWRAQGLNDVWVSVNVSARQFRLGQVLETVQDALRDTGLEPSALHLEFTESVAAAGIDAVVTTLQALRALGVHLAVDDFGTGYSSLSYLRQFPVHSVKIDRSFVQDVGRPQGQALLGSILALVRSLNLTAVVEGVETPAQWAQLRSLPCDLIQGYVISRPVPAPEAGQLLQAGVLPVVPPPAASQAAASPERPRPHPGS